MEDIVKNKFFTIELVRFANIVLTPKFAGAGSKENCYEKITGFRAGNHDDYMGFGQARNKI